MTNTVLNFIGLTIVSATLMYACTSLYPKKTSVIPSNDSLKIALVDTLDHEAIKVNKIDTDDMHSWVDSVYNSMSTDERIGQLFMVAAYSNKNEAHIAEIEKLIRENHIGGVIFFQGGPVRQLQMTNRFIEATKVPLFFGIDAEWGLSMRLDSVPRFPWNMTLGAIQDRKLIEKTGALMAQESARMGIHFNFSPVLDLNTNPKNPIIGVRSFGEDRSEVTKSALALMTGLQSNGLLATGKHFPGHGDTDKDSHYTLPVIKHDKQRMKEVELYPYKKLIQSGLSSVMVAHLNVPAYENRPNHPSSVSKAIVSDLLQDELGFEGLIFTDALNMKGATNFKETGALDLEAFMAGNDILLFPEDVSKGLAVLKSAYANGTITDQRLSHSVKKILKYKYKVKAHLQEKVIIDNIWNDLNSPIHEALNQQLFDAAVVTLKNDRNELPLRFLEDRKIGYVKIGDDSADSFLTALNHFADVTQLSGTSINELLNESESYSTIIIGYHKADNAWRNHNLSENELQVIQQLSAKNSVILCAFTKPYALGAIPNYTSIPAVVVGHQNNEFAHRSVASTLFGAIVSIGKLPVSIHNEFPAGSGLKTKNIQRLGFDFPENTGVKSGVLKKIDSIIFESIDKKIFPGAQVLVAKNGKVIYQKSFGHHTYDQSLPVKNSDLYDVASLTKIMATVPLAMQLYDQKLITMETKLGVMFPEFADTDKASITFKEMMSHYGKLPAWIPFYKKTLSPEGKPSSKYYRFSHSADYPWQVAENLYLRKDYPDSIIQVIAEAPLLKDKEYKYSDLGFIMMKHFFERTYGDTMDRIVQEKFYQSIGMQNTMYNPLVKLDYNRIVPTEQDTYFRHSLVQGYVHDMAAAMQGGVAGHAGLFSTSLDVAKMMQVFLNNGTYGDVKYFSESTMQDFASCHFCNENNRRAIGFDKAPKSSAGPTCGCTSERSFGHTGFTGTMAWVDPENELIYVFLSNRTYPNSNAPNALSRQSIREKIQQIIYNAID